jgi:hypothetical protein
MRILVTFLALVLLCGCKTTMGGLTRQYEVDRSDSMVMLTDHISVLPGEHVNVVVSDHGHAKTLLSNLLVTKISGLDDGRDCVELRLSNQQAHDLHAVKHGSPHLEKAMAE